MKERIITADIAAALLNMATPAPWVVSQRLSTPDEIAIHAPDGEPALDLDSWNAFISASCLTGDPDSINIARANAELAAAAPDLAATVCKMSESIANYLRELAAQSQHGADYDALMVAADIVEAVP